MAEAMEISRVRSPLAIKSLKSTGYVPYDFQSLKSSENLAKMYGKHHNQRKRDFESQIMTLPGPATIGQRRLEESLLGPKKPMQLR